MEVPDSAVFAELQRQLSSPHVNATALWQASGRKKNKSPRSWIPKGDIVHDPGGSADAAILVDHDTALVYAQQLCPKIMRACFEEFSRKLRADPARHLMGCSSPLMGIFAVGAVIETEGLSQEEAGARLMADSVQRSAHLDVYAEETAVANAQRGVRLAAKAIVRG